MEKKRMKIAFLSFYSGQVYRGAETFVHELSNELTDLGHDVTVFQFGSKVSGSKYKTRSVKIPVNWHKKASDTPFVSYYALRIKEFSNLALSKMDQDTDIVFPINGQWQSILSKLWAVKHSKKCVISGQSGPGRDDRINLMAFPDTFVALSKSQAIWAKKAWPFVRVAVIHNGVDLLKFQKKGENKDFKLPKPIILCVSALIDRKRI